MTYNEILKDYSNKKINREVFDFYLKNKIIIKAHSKYDLLLKEYPENSTDLDQLIIFDNVVYEINPLIYDELYDELYYIIECKYFIDYEMSKIEINLFAIYNINDKINFLQNEIRKIVLKHENEPFFLLFMNNTEFNGFTSWNDYLFTHEINFNVIFKYLTIKFNENLILDISNEFVEQWTEFETSKKVLNFLNLKINEINNNADIEIQESKNVLASLPKAIAMLSELGFFELEKVKRLSPEQQAKIICFIQQKDFNDTTKRSISGNIRVLNPDSKEDANKFTSYKHENLVKKMLLEIKQGND